jgi:hypothetical protein
MKTKQAEKEQTGRPAPEHAAGADRQLHILDELYRLAGLAPLHAYQAARADLHSLRGGDTEEP